MTVGNFLAVGLTFHERRHFIAGRRFLLRLKRTLMSIACKMSFSFALAILRTLFITNGLEKGLDMSVDPRNLLQFLCRLAKRICAFSVDTGNVNNFSHV
jgi:hypothetical protein